MHSIGDCSLCLCCWPWLFKLSFHQYEWRFELEFCLYSLYVTKKFQNEQYNLKCFYHDRIHTVYWTDVDWLKKPYKANTDDNLHDLKYTTRKCNGQLICQASMNSGGIKQVLWAKAYLIWGTNYDRGMPISLQCLSRSCSADKECFSGCRSPFCDFWCNHH